MIVEFSRAVAAFAKTTPSVSVTGGTVLSVQAYEEDGLEHAWIFFLDPTGTDDIQFSLLTGQSCEAGGVCAADGTTLSTAPGTRTIPSPEEEEDETAVNRAATGAPIVSGTVQVGETLTADTSGISDADGLTNATFTYQWLADDADIAGAIGSTYTLVTADEGKTVKVRVSFTDEGGNDVTLTSAATGAVDAPEPPAKPTGLSATPSHDRVVLTWDDPNDDTITGYVILRRDKDIHEEGTFETVESDTGSTDTTYTDDTAEPEKQYVYRIKAISAHGVSEISSWVRAHTPAAPTPEPTPEPESVSEGDTDLPNDNSTPGRVAVGGLGHGRHRDRGRSGPVRGGARSGPDLPVRPDGQPGRGRDAAGHLFPGDLQQRGTVPGGQLQRRLRRRPGQPGDVHANGERHLLRAGVGRPGRGRELHAERDRRDATVTGDGIALEVGVSRPMTTTPPARPAPWSSPGRASRGQQEKPAHMDQG